MKEIYRFDQIAPPPLSEAKLRAERERRLLRRSLAVLAVSAVFLFVGLVFLFVRLAPVFPHVSAVCLFALFLAAAGGCAVLLACRLERRLL